jgi:hypothetical protein
MLVGRSGVTLATGTVWSAKSFPGLLRQRSPFLSLVGLCLFDLGAALPVHPLQVLLLLGAS